MIDAIPALVAAHPIAAALLAALLAFGLGLFHFSTLRHVTDLYLGKTRGVAKAALLQLARLALLVVVFILLALAGAPMLLGGAAGLMAGRAVVLRRVKRGI